MADPEIPESLLAAQRRADAARTAVKTASARPGPTSEWPAEAVTGLAEAREEERQAVVALYRERTAAGPEWSSYAAQQRVEEAARGE